MKSILEQALESHLAGELLKAKRLYIEVIKSGTDDPAAHANLAHILKEEGQLDEALRETDIALKNSPTNPILLMNAAGIHLELGNHKKAIDYCRKSLKIQPNNPIALANLGSAYHAIGDLEQAEYFTIKSLNLQPNNAITLSTMGLINFTKSQLKEAFSDAQKALAFNPQLDKAHLLIGKIFDSLGDTKQSKLAFHNALKHNTNCTGALLCLSSQNISKNEALELLKRGESINKDRLNTQDLTSLHYALSACHHRLKDYPKSSQNLELAHLSKSQSYPSNKSHFIKYIHYFRSQSEQKAGRTTNSSSITRTFIVGMPRSGSTLLESVLSMDNNVQDLGETAAMPNAIEELLKTTRQEIIDLPSLEELYSNHLQDRSPQSTKLTIDKQLNNFLYCGLIANNIPNAKIIHSRRNPLDNILSILRNNITPKNNGYAISARDSAMVLIEQEKAMLQYKHQWPDQIFTFDYDNFVEKPKETISPLLKWLNLEWDEKFLRPETNRRSINTASVVQARQPINNKSLGGWRNYRNLLEPARQLILESGLFQQFDLT